MAEPPEADYSVAGFGHDVANGLKRVCDIDIITRQVEWSQCWGDNKIGLGLDNGVFHACMTYTHTAGTRGRYLDFSCAMPPLSLSPTPHPPTLSPSPTPSNYPSPSASPPFGDRYGILDHNKPAGILTRLGTDGKPIVDPTSDLSGKRVVDVKGWAPTADGLHLVTNWCTGKRYCVSSRANAPSPYGCELWVEPQFPCAPCNVCTAGFEILTPDEDGNDAAMKMLRSGEADAMFVYADQAHNYRPDQPGVTPSWDATLWSGFGTEFAYIGTGMLGHAINGTTLAISKKGAGLNAILNPCIAKFMRTKEYHEVS